MKKLIFNIIIFCGVMLFLAQNVNAAITSTPTKAISGKTSPTPSINPSAKPTDSSDDNVGEKLNAQINQLKERIASRVAELNLVEKKGTVGIVSEASGTQITFKDLSGNTRYIDVDEITKFSSPSAKSSFGFSDLVKGTLISVLGQYNKQSERILARFIDAFVVPVYVSGRIAELDKKNFTVIVTDENQKKTKVDVENITNISIYTKEDGISKYGFSKLTIGDRVMVMGFFDKSDPSLLVANRILDLAELPQNPKIIVEEPTEEVTVLPSKKPSVSPAKTSPTPKITSTR